MMKMLSLLVIAMSTLFSSTTIRAAAANANSAPVEWSTSNVIDWSPLSSSSASSSDVLDVLQEQTSRLFGDSYDVILEQTQQIRNQINDRVNVDEYLRNALNSATALANASPQQLQIINDAVSMLGANYAYDATQREIDLHRECIASAYEDLSNAARIVVDGTGMTTPTDAASNWQRMRQVQQYVLSAVRHLQDSCPLCRALKYAASEANQNLLLFVTVLCSSILKTLHPFLADPSSS